MRVSISIAAIVAALVAWVSYTVAQDAKQESGTAAQAWDYRVIALTEMLAEQASLREPEKMVAAIESGFNELGQDGWEYSGDLPGAAVFKRPKR
jgi:hypothetical protein